MDEFGCFRNNAGDVQTIAEMLRSNKIVTFPYCADNETAFIITIAGPITSVGTLPWGGGVNGMFLVSLRKRCAEYFNLRGRDKLLHPDYIAEKLDLGGSDAEVIAHLLNSIHDFLSFPLEGLLTQ